MKKKLFSILLSLAMVITMIPAMTLTVQAEETGTFMELQALIDGSATGSTIVLQKDYAFKTGDANEFSSVRPIRIDKSITLDLNGYGISGTDAFKTEKYEIVQVGSKAEVVIKDSSKSRTGSIEKGYWGVYVAGATFTMYGIGIHKNAYGVTLVGKSKFFMNSGMISRNEESAVKIGQDCLMVMTNGAITQNISNLYAGGIYNYYGTFVMTGGSIDDNHSNNGYAGGVEGGVTYIGGTAKITRNGGKYGASNLYVTAGHEFYVGDGTTMDDVVSEDFYISRPREKFDVGVTLFDERNKKYTSGRITKNGFDENNDYFWSDCPDYYVNSDKKDALDHWDRYLELKEVGDSNLITVQNCNNAMLYSNAQVANPGDEIVLTAVPDEGYEVKEVCVNGKEITPSKEDNQYIFTMPDESVTVKMTLYDKWVSTGVAKAKLTDLKSEKSSFIAKVKKLAKAKVDGYQVRYSTNRNMKNATVKTIKKGTVKKNVRKLKSGKTYYVQVRAFKNKEGNTYYSLWSKVRKVKTK